jgi:hypothetical protein
VAESMSKLGLKSSKPHNFSTVSPNVTCNSSSESYTKNVIYCGSPIIVVLLVYWTILI